MTTTSSARSDFTYVTGLILVAGSANASIVLNDSTDGSGDDLLGLKAIANDSKMISFDNIGLQFDTGVYVTISGSDAVAYIIIA